MVRYNTFFENYDVVRPTWNLIFNYFLLKKKKKFILPKFKHFFHFCLHCLKIGNVF
jgi:hypothetical protein